LYSFLGYCSSSSKDGKEHRLVVRGELSLEAMTLKDSFLIEGQPHAAGYIALLVVEAQHRPGECGNQRIERLAAVLA